METRNLLAGNVQVEKAGHDLLVRGDNRDNQVVIVELAAQRFAVVGIGGTTVSGGTNVNGHSVRTVSGISGNIDVDLRRGDDILGIGNDSQSLVALAEYFGYDSLLGDTDQLQDDLDDLLGGAVGATLDAKNLIIRMGDGDDGVGIVDARIRQRIEADLGSGNNAFGIDPSFIGDDLLLRGGNGIDDVLVFAAEIDQMLDVNLGGGNNFLAVEDSSIGESAVLHTGNGSDFVGLTNTNVEQNLIIRTGSGNDSVFTNDQGSGGVFVGENEDIDTGEGSDFVDIEALVGHVLKIHTGSGNDGVFVAATEVGDDLLIDTGSGNDNTPWPSVRSASSATSAAQAASAWTMWRWATTWKSIWAKATTLWTRKRSGSATTPTSTPATATTRSSWTTPAWPRSLSPCWAAATTISRSATARPKRPFSTADPATTPLPMPAATPSASDV